MIRVLLVTYLLMLCCTQVQAQGKKEYAVAFYNVENLFDTMNDPDTDDDDFTPSGSLRYTNAIYRQKLHNISVVIDKLDAAVVGLAEVENKQVLADLVAQPALSGDKYKYIWYDSPDPRGIDVALLYDPAVFRYISSKPYPVHFSDTRTRDVLYVCGVMAGDTVHILVNHWPSRGEGVRESFPKRAAAATVNKGLVESLRNTHKDCKIIIMGDMNDNPGDASLAKTLGASSTAGSYLYNPFVELHSAGRGSCVYKGKWDMFDQVIISGGFLSGSGLRFHHAEIFDADFIRNKGFKDAYPLRSFKGNNWMNGYSDHLPVKIYLRK